MNEQNYQTKKFFYPESVPVMNGFMVFKAEEIKTGLGGMRYQMFEGDWRSYYMGWWSENDYAKDYSGYKIFLTQEDAEEFIKDHPFFNKVLPVNYLYTIASGIEKKTVIVTSIKVDWNHPN